MNESSIWDLIASIMFEGVPMKPKTDKPLPYTDEGLKKLREEDQEKLKEKLKEKKPVDKTEWYDPDLD